MHITLARHFGLSMHLASGAGHFWKRHRAIFLVSDAADEEPTNKEKVRNRPNIVVCITFIFCSRKLGDLSVLSMNSTFLFSVD